MITLLILSTSSVSGTDDLRSGDRLDLSRSSAVVHAQRRLSALRPRPFPVPVSPAGDRLPARSGGVQRVGVVSQPSHREIGGGQREYPERRRQDGGGCDWTGRRRSRTRYRERTATSRSSMKQLHSLIPRVRTTLDLHLIHSSLGLSESTPKRHRSVQPFCRAHGCYRQTDRQTDHATPSVAIGRI